MDGRELATGFVRSHLKQVLSDMERVQPFVGASYHCLTGLGKETEKCNLLASPCGKMPWMVAWARQSIVRRRHQRPPSRSFKAENF